MFSKNISMKLKLPVCHMYYKTLSTGCRKTVHGNQILLFNMRLARCCSVNNKVLIPEQCTSINQPKSIILSTVKPYLELMRFSRPIGLYNVLYNCLLLIYYIFDFRLVTLILALHMEHCLSCNSRRTSKF